MASYTSPSKIICFQFNYYNLIFILWSPSIKQSYLIYIHICWKVLSKGKLPKRSFMHSKYISHMYVCIYIHAQYKHPWHIYIIYVYIPHLKIITVLLLYLCYFPICRVSVKNCEHSLGKNLLIWRRQIVYFIGSKFHDSNHTSLLFSLQSFPSFPLFFSSVDA